MCKFNLKLLVLFVFCTQLVQISVTSPLGTLLFDDYDDEQVDGDYEVHYDERQNGTENYRLNINGVVIAVPGASNSIGSLASNYLLELAEAAAANQESVGDHGVDDNSTENKPYDFEIPANNHDDKIENPEPVVVISADNITKHENKPARTPVENASVIQDLNPENQIDAIREKESAINKKNLTENVKEDVTLNVDNDKSKDKVIIKESVMPDTNQFSPKVGHKRRNKLKLRIGTLIDYLKRSRQ